MSRFTTNYNQAWGFMQYLLNKLSVKIDIII